MIKTILRALVVNGFALYLASLFISGFHLLTNVQALITVVVAFTAIHLFVKPVVELVLGPINFITFGLLSFAVDVAILFAISQFFPQVAFTPWTFPGITSGILTISSYNLNALETTIVTAGLVNVVRAVLNYLST